jgi:hypothetical protein
VARPVGDRAHGRNTQSVLNVGLQTLFNWDGRYHSLEEQALGVMNEMMAVRWDTTLAALREDEAYRRAFERHYDGEISPATVADALAEFQRTGVYVVSFLTAINPTPPEPLRPRPPVDGPQVLATVWTDPDFDPAQKAFYYARVIEIPTPRWTAYDAFRYGFELPEGVPGSTQERAYTSPIWYSPAGKPKNKG